MPKKKIAQAEVPRSERILDVAEVLFAEHGYEAVSLRQIATGAGVDVALASYHFGKKLDLFEAVFLRRAEKLNQERLAALTAVEAAAGKKRPDVQAIIDAFLTPLKLAQAADDPGWTHYLALLAYINNSPVWGNTLMSRAFDDLVRRFIKALKKALPGAREEDVYWCYHYLSGALTLTLANTGRIDALSGGKCHSDDFEAAYQRMVPFVAAGFREVCGKKKP